VAAVLLFLFCWTPISMLVVRAAQAPYSQRPPDPGNAGAIVILAGSVREPFPPRTFSIPGENTLERCSYGAWYHLRTPTLPVLVSGGKGAQGDYEPYAATMKRFLESSGVPDALIWREDESRSTAENALYSARILRARGIREIVLVTDAVHMARAERCFVRQGISVIAAPCAFRPVYRFDLRDILPSWAAITWNEGLLHEWIGTVWYRLRGVA
jgi:uncharacterized SAM-binding protein YcdF (DUF218 family)